MSPTFIWEFFRCLPKRYQVDTSVSLAAQKRYPMQVPGTATPRSQKKGLRRQKGGAGAENQVLPKEARLFVQLLPAALFLFTPAQSV